MLNLGLAGPCGGPFEVALVSGSMVGICVCVESMVFRGWLDHEVALWGRPCVGDDVW